MTSRIKYPPVTVLELWDDQHILIGHGLAKDLHALGIVDEDVLRTREKFDTMTFPKFQGKGGNARSLKRLAKDILGVDIQERGVLHDPEIDAAIVLRVSAQ